MNSTNSQNGSFAYVNGADASKFTISWAGNSNTNANGSSYVAYLFAHDPSENGKIQCGSYVGNGTNQHIELGWEPQWILRRGATQLDNWAILDSMRGFTVGGNDARLYANTSDAEVGHSDWFSPTSTGFYLNSGTANGNGETQIYCAIRATQKTPVNSREVFATSKYS